MAVNPSKKRDLTVTFTRRDHMETVVEVTLGSGVRSFNVCEFRNFWVTIFEEERKATSAYLAALDYSPGQENGRRD